VIETKYHWEIWLLLLGLSGEGENRPGTAEVINVHKVWHDWRKFTDWRHKQIVFCSWLRLLIVYCATNNLIASEKKQITAYINICNLSTRVCQHWIVLNEMLNCVNLQVQVVNCVDDLYWLGPKLRDLSS